MAKTIELPDSLFQIKFRVIGYPNGEGCMLFSSDSYGACEEFCWNYTGKASELRIDRVWVRK